MTVSETFQVVASTPPTDLPHTTAAAEIARLPTYLSVTHQRDDGTDYIVTDAAYKDEAGNAGRIYVQRNDTDNSIEAIQSKVNGVWTNFKVTVDSIADDAVTTPKILDENVTGMKLAAGIAGDGLKFTDTTVGDATTRVMHAEADETSLSIDETTKKLRIKAAATGVSLAAPSLAAPSITDQISLNAGTPHEIRIGSNEEGDDVDDYRHGWIGSWAGVPIDIYIQSVSDGTTSIYHFEHQKMTITQNGRTVEVAVDADGNVTTTTTGGTGQNQFWKSTRVTTKSTIAGLEAGEVMQLCGDGALALRTLKLLSLPTSAVGLSSGDVWNNSGVLTVVT